MEEHSLGHLTAHRTLERIGVAIIASWDRRRLYFPSPPNEDNAHPRRRFLLWHPSQKAYAHFIGTSSNIKSVTTNWVHQDS
jgi:hypothetical protein